MTKYIGFHYDQKNLTPQELEIVKSCETIEKRSEQKEKEQKERQQSDRNSKILVARSLPEVNEWAEIDKKIFELYKESQNKIRPLMKKQETLWKKIRQDSGFAKDDYIYDWDILPIKSHGYADRARDEVRSYDAETLESAKESVREEILDDVIAQTHAVRPRIQEIDRYSRCKTEEVQSFINEYLSKPNNRHARISRALER